MKEFRIVAVDGHGNSFDVDEAAKICPNHVTLWPDHFRGPEQPCRCDDPAEPRMSSLGFDWDEATRRWMRRANATPPVVTELEGSESRLAHIGLPDGSWGTLCGYVPVREGTRDEGDRTGWCAECVALAADPPAPIHRRLP